ncbi:MAG: MerR family transcriptional regulator [Actinomycetota bacterium]|nr:MerR family transcriptional regulator [Actinomycetota bacterium]
MEATTATELTISEAAGASGVSAHTLRYYERAGLVEPVERVASGHRRYAAEDMERVRFIGYLRSTGMPIRGIRRYFELAREGEHTAPQRLELLERHREAVRSGLEQSRRNLAAIDRKIQKYKEGTIH